MSKLYAVDPDGDLLITLLPFEGAFALWNDSDDLEASLLDLPKSDSGVGIISSPDDETLPASDTSPSQLHFKVSSKHLILASRYYKIMLTGEWSEGKIIHEDGYRRVTWKGFDPAALELVLDIIHGKTREVCRTLDLEMLAKVAIVVDYMKCHEVVEIFSEIWLSQLPKSLPTEYNRDLLLWILVSSVFRQSAQFKSVTRTAILHSTGPIDTLGLPVHHLIVDKIDGRRQELLDRLVKVLYDFLDKLRDGQPRCSFECDSILLGAFMKQMPHDLIWPRPSTPFTGLSFAKTAETIRRFQSPAWRTIEEPAAKAVSLFSSPAWRAVDESAAEVNVEEERVISKSKNKKGQKKSARGMVGEVRKCPQYRCSFQDLLDPEIDRLEKNIKGLDFERDVGV